MPWSTDLRRELIELFPLTQGLSPIPDDVLLSPKWLLSIAADLQSGSNRLENPDAFQFSMAPERAKMDDQILVELEENKRMTPSNHWQDVRHLTFTSKSAASYLPGDVLTIFPRNSVEDIELLIERMQWGEVADQLVMLAPTTSSSSPEWLSSPPLSISLKRSITFRQMLINHLDMTAIPRRSFFSLIGHFTDDQFQKERLFEFTNPEYIDELYDYTTRPRRSILEVLQEFDTVMIPWQWAANILPELRGRQFSIASGGRLKQSSTGLARFELLVAVVRYKTVIRKIREGVCTRYLSNLSPGAQVIVTLQKGSLGTKKTDLSRPVIMIGPGTGVAPMRSLIWERFQWAEELPQSIDLLPSGDTNSVISIGKSLLIYGCRNQSADYFYQDEWQELKDKMPLEMHTAFSRDQASKVYVQDVVRQLNKEIFELIYDMGGTVYVCGSSGKMPTAVRAALVDVFRVYGGMNQTAAEAYLENMEKKGRYKQETWG